MLSRRSLLKGAAVAGVTVGASLRGLLPANPIHAAPKRKRVFYLSAKYACRQGQLPDGTPRRPRKTCVGCKACESHAAHKLFAGARVAQDRVLRAHKNCNCAVRSKLISQRAYSKLFGFPDCKDQGRRVFDDRKDTLYERCSA